MKGEIDATDTRISADTIDRLKKGDNVTIAHDESMRTFVMTMNNSRKPLDNIHVRRAISYAFDYDGYIAKLREGTVVRNPGPIPETVWGAPKDLKGYTRDVAKAREELELAQQGRGRPVAHTDTICHDQFTQTQFCAAQLLQSALRQLGYQDRNQRRVLSAASPRWRPTKIQRPTCGFIGSARFSSTRPTGSAKCTIRAIREPGRLRRITIIPRSTISSARRLQSPIRTNAGRSTSRPVAWSSMMLRRFGSTTQSNIAD